MLGRAEQAVGGVIKICTRVRRCPADSARHLPKFLTPLTRELRSSSSPLLPSLSSAALTKILTMQSKNIIAQEYDKSDVYFIYPKDPGDCIHSMKDVDML